MEHDKCSTEAVFVQNKTAIGLQQEQHYSVHQLEKILQTNTFQVSLVDRRLVSSNTGKMQ